MITRRYSLLGAVLVSVFLLSTLVGAGGTAAGEENYDVSIILTVFGEGDFVTHASTALQYLSDAVREYSDSGPGVGAAVELVIAPAGTDASWTAKKRELLSIALSRFSRMSDGAFGAVTSLPWGDVVLEHDGTLTGAPLARSMNKGAVVAKGNVILFVGGHVLLEKNAIGPLIAALDDELVGASSLVRDTLAGVDEKLEVEAASLDSLLLQIYGSGDEDDVIPVDEGADGNSTDGESVGEKEAAKDKVAQEEEGETRDTEENDENALQQEKAAEEEDRAEKERRRPLPPRKWPVAIDLKEHKPRVAIACGLLTSPWGTVSDAGLELLMERTPDCKGKHKWAKKRLISNDCSTLDPRSFEVTVGGEGEDEEVAKRRIRLVHAVSGHWQHLDEGKRAADERKWPTLLYEHTALPFSRLEGEAAADARLTGDQQEILAGTGLLMALPRELFLSIGGFDEAYRNAESSSRYTCNFAALELSLLMDTFSWKTVLVPASRGTVMESLEKEVVTATASEVTDARLFGMRWRDKATEMVEGRWLSRQPVAWDMECQAGETLGFTVEAIGIVSALEPLLPLTVVVSNRHQCLKDMRALELQPHLIRTLDRLISKTPTATEKHLVDSHSELITVLHHDPGRFSDFAARHVFGKLFVVGRSMYETDTIPQDWLQGCSLEVDELWVPSQFNVDTFTSAGVDAAKIKVVPEPVDVFSYSAEMYSGDDTPLDNTFTFLTVMKWEERKAWRELLTAYAEEFAAGEEVELVIRSSLEEDNWSELDELLEELKQDRSTELPQITVLEEAVPFWKMSSLYAMADAFVLASHGEGWGLPLIQAMSMGLPTIGTNWSGNTEFMDADNALLVDVGELVEVEGRAGHRWALPAHNSLRSQLRAAFSMSPGRREELGQKARDSASAFSSERVAAEILARLEDITSHSAERRAQKEKREAEREAFLEDANAQKEEAAREQRAKREEERKASRSKMFGSWMKNAIESVEVDGKTLFKVPIVDHV